MQAAHNRRRLIRVRVFSLAAVCAVGALAAVLAAYRVSFSPLGLHPRAVQFATAQADVLVDTPTSQLQMLTNEWGLVGPARMALTYSTFLQTDAARTAVADAAGIPGKEVGVSGPFTYIPPPPRLSIGSLTAASPTNEDNNYRLVVDVAQLRPMLTLYGQAPTERAAIAIVDAARGFLMTKVGALEATARESVADRTVIRPLGPTTGGVVDRSGRVQLMIAVFLVVLFAGGGLIAAFERRRRAARAGSSEPELDWDAPGDDWPHTNRLLPWSIAFFVAMLFLVPIDAVSLPVHLPLDAKPDRAVLVVIALLWLLALGVAGGDLRPRVRFTRIHWTALGFLGFCCLGVGLNAHELITNQEVVAVLKKLVLLVSFILFFVIAASVLRPREVPRMIGLIVILGVIVAIGAIVERETKYNVFYSVWRGILRVQTPKGLDQIDDTGRIFVAGPTNQPLELAALLAIVLPLAIVGALGAGSRRRRFAYLAASAILIAGGIATYRKTSVVAPVAAVLVLLAYRPRPMLRGLLVVGPPLLVTVHLLVPGQIGKLWQELLPSNLTTVASTTSRTARYDAVRPDVMSHLLVGRGYESYDPFKYRVLDNEYLGLLINVGVIGLLAFVSLFVSFMFVAHPMIRGPDRRRVNAALGLQAAMVVVLVSSFLFDALGFTHVSYMSLFVGAMILALREPQPSAQTSTERAPARTVSPAGAAA